MTHLNSNCIRLLRLLFHHTAAKPCQLAFYKRQFILYVVWIYFKITCMLSHFSCVRLFATPGTVARQAPLSMESSRQEYWSGLPFPFPGDLPDSGIEPRSPILQADSLQSEPPRKSSYLFPQIRDFFFFFF